MLQEYWMTEGRFNLTLDGWTASNNHSFLGITVHWVDSEWVLWAKLLAFKPLSKSHTAQNLCDVLVDAVQW